MIRKLTESDRSRAFEFCKQHIETAFFLASALDKAPMAFDEQVDYSGDYYAEFDGEVIIAIAAYCWLGSLVICAPDGGQRLLEFIKQDVISIGWTISAFLSESRAAQVALEIFNLEGAETAINGAENIMALDLSKIKTPEQLNDPAIKTHKPTQDDLDILIQWRIAYNIEAIGKDAGEALNEHSRKEIQRFMEVGDHLTLFHNNVPVSYVNFNAGIDGYVQIGPVWTPPEYRNKGYARTALAAKLIEARQHKGTKVALLFTDIPAAIKAYMAVGFEDTGLKYNLCIFKEKQEIRG